MLECNAYITAQLIVFLCLLLAVPSSSETGSPRVVTTKYGKLRGVIRPLNNRNLRSVEVFLGIPYATPPTGTNRFSPTRSPNSWSGERFASQYGPVCPQHFPDVWNSHFEDEVPKSFAKFIRKLKSHLAHQDEDCLYLNVYVPSLVADTVGHKALPVMVFIHGGSYEWGAGNPFDGSVFAAHAEVIVVTLNYRLGPLGFLNTNADSSKRSHVMNHGLMDQIAALHWIQESIGAFGGDPGSITLLGHGTGAACIQLLMVSSAVVPGLFHRAMLLSGSALSSWATVRSPIYYAVKFGKALNCTRNLSLDGASDAIDQVSNDEMDAMVNCLKEKPLEEFNSVHIEAPRFLHAFAPSVDGIVIQSDYESEIHKLGDESQSEYDLLFGVVTHESYNDFSEADLTNGFSAEHRDKIFRTFIRNVFDYHLNEVFISVVNEYTDWDKSIVSYKDVRDGTLEALSDASYIGPLVKTSKNLRTVEKKQYFYVFNYTTSPNQNAFKWGAVHGDELPYIFGAPLVQELGVYGGNWTESDQIVSEAMLTYFGNFVKTGNPNYQRDQRSMASHTQKKKFHTSNWHRYDSIYQKYMLIGSVPEAKDHYRAHSLALWTWLIPQLQKVGKLEFNSVNDASTKESNDSNWSHLQELSVLHHLFTNHEDPNLYSGRVRPVKQMDGHYIMPLTTTTPHPTTTPQNAQTDIRSDQSNHDSNTTVLAEATMAEHAGRYVSYSTALSVTIAIGASILILNVLIIAGVYYQKDKAKNATKQEQQSQHASQSSSEDQMPTITGVTGPLIGPNIKELKNINKKHFSTSPKSSNPLHLDNILSFAHISNCPPAFADKSAADTITTSHCTFSSPTLPNGMATQISSGMTIQCPPPPRLFSSESQPLLPVTVPSPPKSKIPNYDDMHV